MRKLFTTLSLTAGIALVSAPSAEAQSKDWLVCGGNSTTFSTCASVFLTVEDPNPSQLGEQRRVTMKIWNLGGMGDSYEGGVFTKIGFFHQDYKRGGGINASAVAGSLSMSGPTHNAPAQWKLGNPNNAGGVVLDLAAHNGKGVDNGIAAGCDTSLLPAGKNAWLNPCYDQFMHDPDVNPNSWITMSFDVVGTWDLATSEMLIFVQSGEGKDDSLQCITGGKKLNCEPVQVPEPTTWLLLATGLGGLGLARIRRRRDSEFDVTA